MPTPPNCSVTPPSPPPPPGVPPTPSNYYNARFIADVNLPDNSVVQPGQSLNKTWTMRNTGTQSWGAGFQLAFIGGVRLGAPAAISVPATAPGQNRNLTVPLNIPANLGPGTYTGRWKLRNAQGTFFGDEIWFKLQIGNTQPPGGNGAAVEVVSITDSPATVSPGQTFRPSITVRVNNGQLRQDRGDMLRFTSGTNYSGFPHIAVQGIINSGQSTTFQFYSDHPIVAPTTDGTYEMRWNVWANGGEVGDEIVIRFTVSQFPNGHPPQRPTLTSPGDWAVIVGQPPQLCAQHNGDPDGDSITHYRFAIIDSANLWDSGWVTSNCATPTNLGNYGYQWYAKVRDSRGVESDWSDRRRFNLESSTVTINEFYFQPPSPSNVETVIIRAGTTGCGGVGVGLKALVNTASDGSANGEWRTIKELGVPRFNDEDAPRWDTLEYAQGVHRVRIEATSCDGTKVHQEQLYTLLRGKPSRPYLLSPSNTFWSNSRTITFGWSSAMRANTYTVIVGTSADLQSGILRTISQAGTSYTATFDQDYPQLYWKVIATNEHGTTEQGVRSVGIDPNPPTSTINAAQTPALVYDIQIPVSWSGSDDRSGIHTYDIQVREDADGLWTDWLTGFPNAAAIYTGQPGHRYAFRSRARDIAGNTEPYPVEPDVIVVVDLTKRPPQVWGSPSSRLKYGVLVVNPQANAVLPVGYPVQLHFDSATTPTAAELYAASTATQKGADVRLWYNDQTELPRYIATFTPSVIDLWFPNQTVIAASGSSSAYAVYVDNPQATPPNNAPETVLAPGNDANTQVLMYFDEAAGAISTDLSGKGNNGTLQGGFTWPSGKFRTGLSFNGNAAVSIPNAASLQFGTQLTIEAWVRPTLLDTNTRNIVAKTHPNQGSSFRLFTRSNGYLVFVIYSNGTLSQVELPQGLTVNQWSHIAASYDGSALRVYINGIERGAVAYNQPISAATAALVVGNTGYGNEPFVGDIDQLRISNIGRTSFAYGSVIVNPTVAAGVGQIRDDRGPTHLVIQDVYTQSSPEGGLLVQAVIHNSGVYSTSNQVRTDIYANYVPTGPNDLQNSVGHWVTDSILPGATITLTKVIAAADFPAALNRLLQPNDQSYAIAVQVDSLGMVQSTNGGTPIIASEPEEVCVASPDIYEDDGTSSQARTLAIGNVQQRTFDRLADQDWIRFTAMQGITYTLQTTNLSLNADTMIALYDQDQTTVLAENDDSNGELASYLAWNAPASGTYYINVRNWNPGNGGCGMTYDVSLAGRAVTFLPLMRR